MVAAQFAIGLADWELHFAASGFECGLPRSPFDRPGVHRRLSSFNSAASLYLVLTTLTISIFLFDLNAVAILDHAD